MKRSIVPAICSCGVLFLCELVLCALAGAQVSKVAATLEGTVVDSTGAAVGGAQVHLRNLETSQTRQITSDEQGVFRATEIPSGTYEVQIELAGFATYRHAGVNLSIGQTVHLNVQLVPAEFRQQITVTDQPPPIDPSQTTSATIVENEKIEQLPVRSRNYLDFVLLAPGVSASAQQQATGSQSQLSDSGLIFGGLRARSNNLSIDGLDNNDEFSGASRTELSLETIREFQVVNNGLSAETGGASGGSINVVTKTGSNSFRGDVFLFGQTGALNARNSLEAAPVKPDLARLRGGFSLGGPLVKNRTFFYLAAEQEHMRTESASEIKGAVAETINSFLASGAFPGLTIRYITTSFLPVTRAETEFSGKVNHQWGQHSLMIRTAFTDSRRASDAFNTITLDDASARGSTFTKDIALAGSVASVLGTTRVNDLRFQLASRRVVLRTSDQSGPGIDIDGLLNLGRSYDGNGRRREIHNEVSDTLSYARGAQVLKIGATMNHVHLSVASPDGFGGIYIFPALADFLVGKPDYFRQSFGQPSTRFAVTSVGGFVQEHWSATHHLTLDLGLRFDFEHLPAAFHEDFNNLSPRIGLAYSPASAWVFRAGFGVFYDRYILAFLNRAIQKDGVRAFEQVAEGDAAAAIFQQVAGGKLPAPVPGLRPSIFRSDIGLSTPYSEQVNASIEHLLAKNLTASATYLFVRGVKLPRTFNVNLLPPVILTPTNAESLGVPNPTPQQLGREVFSTARKDLTFDSVYQLENSSSSTYHGLSLTLNKRMSNELAFSANYTLSKTVDDASDFDEQSQNPFDLRADRSLSLSHQRHRFVLSALIDLPFGEEKGSHQTSTSIKDKHDLRASIFSHISFAPIVSLGSGRPVNPLTGVDSSRNEAFPLSARPLGLSRNSRRPPAFTSIDLRVVKFLKFPAGRRLNFVLEFFNVLNHRNITQINPFFGSGSAPLSGFATPTDAANGRQVQLSLDFEF